MGRRTPREDRKAPHRRPGRNLSSRSKQARRIQERDEPTTEVVRFTDSRRHDRDRVTVPAIVCPKGKKGFPEHVARAKLAEYAADTSPRANRPVRVYRCPECSTDARPSWHLTSQPFRGPAAEAS